MVVQSPQSGRPEKPRAGKEEAQERADRMRSPAYEVTINIGKRAEPSITAVRALPLDAPK